MNRRGIIGAAFMALLFLLFLFALYRAGFVGLTGSVLLMATGIACVWASHHFYSRMWPDDEQPHPDGTNPDAKS